jgi:ribonuclease BN (tRNA processing enzyme)
VVITHQHADHAADLIGLAYARRFPEPLRTIPVYAPAATLDVLARLDELFAVPTLPLMGHTIASSFDLHPLRMDGASIPLTDDLRLESFAARHAVPSAALRLRSVDGRTVAFSSDTWRADGVVAAARGSDLFFCEATYLHASAAELEGHGHLTPDLAGAIAAQADAGQLVLAHLPAGTDHGAIADAAATSFDPHRTTIAVAGRQYDV